MHRSCISVSMTANSKPERVPVCSMTKSDLMTIGMVSLFLRICLPNRRPIARFWRKCILSHAIACPTLRSSLTYGRRDYWARQEA